MASRQGGSIRYRRAVGSLTFSCLAFLVGLGALSAAAQAAPTYRYTDQSTSYVGNEDNSYVIGYLFPGTYADVQHVSPSGEFGYGRIGSTSNFGAWDNGHHCGWAQLTKEGTTLMTKGAKVSTEDVCPEPGDGNLAPAAIFKSGTYEAGCGTGCVQSAVVLPQCRDLNVYANYDPQTGGIFDPDGTESPGRGTPGYGGVPQQAVTTPVAGFGTRYMTKDSNVVLIKDTSRPGEKTAWGFMKAECIAGSQVGNPSRPPEAFTDPPSELTSTTAKLNGSVNPSGSPTSYYFEWGPSAAYGNFIPGPPPGESIGRNEQFVYTWNVIGGLTPGATYHYRLAATNGGTVRYGADQSFTEPSPPTAITSAPSEITETSAKLNGSVNPDGWDTHYYFQYGPTTTYADVIPAKPGLDLGAGTAPIYTWNNIGGLDPGTTYHYRDVAVNSAGETSYGSDQTFQTASRPAPVLQENGDKSVFYHGSNNTIWDWSYHGPTWTNRDPGGSPVGSPSSVVGKNVTDTFYRGTDGTIWDLDWNGTTFTNYHLGGAAAGDPSAVGLSGGGEDAFYRGTNGAIWGEIWNGSGWTTKELGGSATGTPSAVVAGSSVDVYYRGTDGTIWDWEWNGTKWTDAHLGGAAAGDPSAVALSGGGEDIFYRGSNGAIWGEIWNGSGWTTKELGGSATGTPSAVVGKSTTDVYYRGTDGTIWDWEWNGTKWTDSDLGGSAAGSPAALLTSSGNEDAYYEGTNGAIWGQIWTGSGWTNSEVGLDPPVASTGPASVQETQATLNGFVNPNSKDSHYYFQYGETISYEHSTPVPPGTDAGSGIGEVPASATATGLLPATTYHFRIVAENAGGVTRGADRTFQTASRPSPVLLASGDKSVFYHGSNDTIWDWSYHSPTWTDFDPGGSPLGAPSAVANKSATDTFYRGTDGTIWDLDWNGTTFTNYHLGGPAAGDPSAVVLSGGGEDAFYRGTNGAIWGEIWNGSGWTTKELGGSATGTPSAVVAGSSVDVYYRGTDGTIWDWEWNGTNWTDAHLGGATAGDPSAVRLTGGGEDIFYRGTSGALWGQIWNGSGWTSKELGGSATGTPSAVVGKSTTDVYYRGTDGTIWDWEWNGTTWTDLHLGGSAAGSPSALPTSSGNEDVYYEGANGAIWGQIWNGSGWSNTEL